MSAYLQRDVRLWRAYSSTSSQSAVGSRTIRVHHLREAACLIGSDLHTMHHQKFRKSVSCLFGSWGLRAPGRVSVPAPSAHTRTGGSAAELAPRSAPRPHSATLLFALPTQTGQYRLSEPMPTLTSNTTPGALAFLCDARIRH
jgi:hypothetical protein